jgi:hypothetical protein
MQESAVDIFRIEDKSVHRSPAESFGRIIQERRPQRVTIQFETGGAL